jgi:molybdopterin-guanine dinucleotide biosynthesis protein A
MYHQPVNDVAAFVLAGGKSSRMGKDRDKAFLELEGRSLLSRTLELAATVSDNVSIVGNGAKYFPFGKTVDDVYPEHGPLGGIHAALTATESRLNLILAVDLPFLETSFLHYLVSEASRGSALVTVPKSVERWHPLCAVYRREFAADAEKALHRGRNKIDSLFAQVETRVIDDDELSRMNFSPTMFHNVNTPQDWTYAEANLRSRSQR